MYFFTIWWLRENRAFWQTGVSQSLKEIFFGPFTFDLIKCPHQTTRTYFLQIQTSGPFLSAPPPSIKNICWNSHILKVSQILTSNLIKTTNWQNLPNVAGDFTACIYNIYMPFFFPYFHGGQKCVHEMWTHHPGCLGLICSHILLVLGLFWPLSRPIPLSVSSFWPLSRPIPLSVSSFWGQV